MSLLRHKPLVVPDFGFDGPTFFDDSSGDLWFIDEDGDILFVDWEEEPDGPYQVRRVTDVKLGDTDDNDEIEKAIADSVVIINFRWSSFVDGSIKQN